MSELRSLLSLLADHTGTVLWLAFKGALIWGSISLVACLGLYFLVTRMGWLNIRGQPRRWAKVIYGLVLFGLCGPLATGAGVVTGVRDATVKIVKTEVQKTAALRLVGSVLLAPVVLAHLTAEEDHSGAKAAATSWKQLESNDLSFLLKAPTRERAFKKLNADLVRQGARQVPGYQKAKKKRVLGWLVTLAERRAAAAATKKISRYRKLFDDIKGDDQGKLRFEPAADQVGGAFFVQIVKPVIHSPFNSFRLKLLIGAGAAFALTILLIHLIGRAVIKKAPQNRGEGARGGTDGSG